MPFRIAVIHNFYKAAQPSGENEAVIQQVKSLKAAGHEVELVSTNSDDEFGGPFALFQAGFNVSFQGGAKLGDRIKKFEPDVIIVHNTFAAIDHRSLIDLNIPIILSLHNYRTICANGLQLRKGLPCNKCSESSSLWSVVHGCYRDSRLATIPLALSTRDSGANNLLISKAKVVTVLHAEALAAFNRAFPEHKKFEIVPNFVDDIPHGVKVRSGWLFVGRLSPEKGVEELVEMWPKGFPLRIVGDGPLRERLETHGNEDILFLGQRNKGEIRSMMAESVGLVIPSIAREGLPLVYLEALASGTPVIARSTNYISELCSQEGTGVDYISKVELEAALSRVNSDSTTFGTRAREVYLSKYSEETWLLKISSILSKACA